MRTRRVLWILLLVGSVALATRWVWIHSSASLSPDEVNAAEAVFRYEIDKMEKEIPGTTHYISVKNLDPPKELLAKLKSRNLRVERGSLFSSELLVKGAWHWVIHDLERLDSQIFLVSGGYENDGLSAKEDEYTVVQRGGRWIVAKVVGRWVA